MRCVEWHFAYNTCGAHADTYTGGMHTYTHCGQQRQWIHQRQTATISPEAAAAADTRTGPYHIIFRTSWHSHSGIAHTPVASVWYNTLTQTTTTCIKAILLLTHRHKLLLFIIHMHIAYMNGSYLTQSLRIYEQFWWEFVCVHIYSSCFSCIYVGVCLRIRLYVTGPFLCASLEVKAFECRRLVVECKIKNINTHAQWTFSCRIEWRKKKQIPMMYIHAQVHRCAHWE